MSTTDIDLMLRGYNVFPSSASGLGFTNAYTNYKAMTDTLWNKCSGRDVWGNYIAYTVVMFLKAFIIGQGARFTYTGEDDNEKQRFEDFTNDFLKFNNETSGQFDDMIEDLIKGGKIVIELKQKDRKHSQGVKLQRHAYSPENNYTLRTADDKDISSVYDIDDGFIVKGSNYSNGLSSSKDNLVYGRIGDNRSYNDTPYKPHLVLTEMENMDRALKDIRRLNYISARVTPSFQTDNANETSATAQQIKNNGWKLGAAWVGTAKLSYEAPNNTSAVDMLTKEIGDNLKTISGITGIPVHYLGHADILSNRATAETLFDAIRISTQSERNEVRDILYNTLLTAQQVYIDKQLGGTIDKLIKNFNVELSVLDYSRFESMVKALSLAKADDVISKETYRSFIPNVDPVKEEETIDAEKIDDQLRDIRNGAED